MRATTHIHETHCPEHDERVVIGFEVHPAEPEIGARNEYIADAWIESQECGCTFDAFAIAEDS